MELLRTRAASGNRIAFVSDTIYPYNTGGKEIRLYELSTRLANMGYQVDIYTMQWWSGSKHKTRGGVHLHAISKLYPIYTGDRRSIREAIMFGFSCLKMLAVDFENIDVDHIPYFPLFSMKLVCLLKSKPMAATWHEVWGKEYWMTYLGPIKGRIAYWLELLSAKTPDRITAVSDDTAAKLKESLSYNGPLAVVPPGIDLSAIASITAAKQRSDVFYSGRLLSHKGVDLIVQATALLKKKRPGITVVIAGDGPEAAQLRALSRANGLESNITFTGFIKNHNDVLAMMKATKVFVSPSMREGFGMSILEANACGTLAVTSNHPDNAARFLINQPTNGYVCAPEVDALAAAIEAALNRPSTALRRRQVAATTQVYDWPAITQMLVEVM